ncbi:hypothetical protein F5878DRAFT_646819, partial [Lentinula raphanica]
EEWIDSRLATHYQTVVNLPSVSVRPPTDDPPSEPEDYLTLTDLLSGLSAEATNSVLACLNFTSWGVFFNPSRVAPNPLLTTCDTGDGKIRSILQHPILYKTLYLMVGRAETCNVYNPSITELRDGTRRVQREVGLRQVLQEADSCNAHAGNLFQLVDFILASSGGILKAKTYPQFPGDVCRTDRDDFRPTVDLPVRDPPTPITTNEDLLRMYAHFKDPLPFPHTVPIYDGRGVEGLPPFSALPWEYSRIGQRCYPLYNNGSTDVPPNSIVTVGFTAHMWMPRTPLQGLCHCVSFGLHCYVQFILIVLPRVSPLHPRLLLHIVLPVHPVLLLLDLPMWLAPPGSIVMSCTIKIFTISVPTILKCRLSSIDARVMHTFLYSHPEAETPFVQHYGFRVYTNDDTRLFQIIVDIMCSEYVLPDTSIQNLYVVNDDYAPTPGAKFLVIFLNDPVRRSPPTGTPPIQPGTVEQNTPSRVSPISDLHVIILGILADGNIRSITNLNFQSLWYLFEFNLQSHPFRTPYWRRALLVRNGSRFKHISVLSRFTVASSSLCWDLQLGQNSFFFPFYPGTSPFHGFKSYLERIINFVNSPGMLPFLVHVGVLQLPFSSYQAAMASNLSPLASARQIASSPALPQS